MMEPTSEPNPAIPTIMEPEVETIFNRPYIVSIQGLVRLACVIFSITTFVCASVWNANGDNPAGAGWAIFVAVSSLLMSVLFYMFHFFNVYNKMLKAAPQWLVVEMIAHGLYTVMYLVSGILAAVYSAHHPATGATCFFAYSCMITYAIETFFSYQAFRTYNPPSLPNPMPRAPVTSSVTTISQPTSGGPGVANPTY